MSSPEDMIWEIKENYGLNSPRVFEAMLQIPRAKFVSSKYQNRAYSDTPILIGFGQTMSQPYTVAFMTHLLVDIDAVKNYKVLEIGTGSGYQAAILSKLFREVYTVEIIPKLAKDAKKRLEALDLRNILVKEGSGEWGWEEHAPYDAIIVTASVVDKVPNELFDQLKNKGVLVIPIAKDDGSIMTRYIKNTKVKYKKEEFGTFYFVPFVKKGSSVRIS
ncbi:protein-L-isoaspartate O-methyltransferase [Candidatus Woesebacteria bacterium RBG_16_36_11]|uniref:Protein-L-isoaspartate O-methyltransferase n=3 Tax=Candidatus Woeseibacteriota TaxID=1752722 RepID=A0A1F7X7N7_9BACT|nr:MAG: protein-L-isoaspartate O-methyltransferase [Candidatus Woesebacteria bacterium RBG_13_36_22]OGM11080.1 MAG: protein-L-isoaspartate O-methyltransferase [Candidatus Woesebacteria bacterium RBG_16_36_11]OGM17141.1 MAG: protein-L-isoaspartate O-methyltransferase [Candidatus Woesebacteria bacterium RBG_19FT_COMBO_37_29]